MDNTEKLLGEFLDKIKTKSVYATLKKIMGGKTQNKFFVLKGLYSLAVHLSIELEKGNPEYMDVLLNVNEKIQKLIKSCQ